MTSYILIWHNASPDSQETAEMLFQHLCTLIDDPKIDHKSKAFKLAEQLIVDGKCLKHLCLLQFLHCRNHHCYHY